MLLNHDALVPDPSNNGTGETRPPARPVRKFVYEQDEWIAWLSGCGAYGTGVAGWAPVHAVHFAKADAPDAPLFEALSPAERFWGLYDVELIEIFRCARRVVGPSERPEKPISRRGEGLP